MNKDNKKKHMFLIVITVIILTSCLVAALQQLWNYQRIQKLLEESKEASKVSYITLLEKIESKEVESLKMDSYNKLLLAKLSDGKSVIASYPATDDTNDKIYSYDVPIDPVRLYTTDEIKKYSKPLVFDFSAAYHYTIIFIFAYFCFYALKSILSSTKTIGSSLSSITGESRFSFVEPEDIDDTEVAGLDSILVDIDSLITLVKNREKFKTNGIECPKGVLLEGPPGVGKTMIAKHIAKAANLPFISCCGSDFIEMYVGLGAKRIRDLFKTAREKEEGCVIFIDEVDTVASKRSASNSSSEDSRTLNSLLKEMDGLTKSNEKVVVIAATNLVSALDPAFIRPGRFNRTISIQPPSTKKDREAIIDVHLKHKKLSDDFDKTFLLEITKGMTGADISNIINNAVIESVIHDDDGVINNHYIEVALDKTLLKGNPLESTNEEANWRVSVHEAGHAVIGLLTGKQVLKVTRIGTTSGVGGVTLSVDSKEMMLKSRTELMDEIRGLYGGIIAESLILKEPSVGASNDIERATQLIRTYVGTCGLGGTYLNMKDMDNEKFTEMCMTLARQVQESTRILMQEHKDLLLAIADDVMKNKSVYKLNEKYASMLPPTEELRGEEEDVAANI